MLNNNRRYFLAAIPGLVALAGCTGENASSSATTAGAGSAATGRPTVTEIKSAAKGFSVGNVMAAAQVYVFFDPQCPHCGMMWDEIKPLLPKMHFRWIPVGLMTAQSTLQGAAILSAANPADAMTSHKQSLLAKTGGISANNVTPEFKAIIEANTKLFERLKPQGVPYLIGLHVTTAAEVVVPGGMPAAGLASKFGVVG